MEIPLVSVKMITFNHKNYISRAIEGVLMQQTDFRFELVIGDDCSTDGTSELISEYVAKYPGIIRHIIRKENLGAKRNAQDLNSYLGGKYVALCEGDDYWTDPFKLQKQADFLRTHPEFTLCFHSANVIREDNIETDLFKDLEEREYTPNEILLKWLVPTGSVLVVREYYSKLYYHPDYIFTDIALFLTLAEYGKIWCMKEPMSVYRRHTSGITQKKLTVKMKKLHYTALNIHFKEIYNKEIRVLLSSVYLSEAKVLQKKKSLSFIWFLISAFIYSPSFSIKYLCKYFIPKDNNR
jgi:glycosyltransferase involved in cell wall biosynthesis